MKKVRKIAMPVPYNEKKIEYIRQQESEEKGKKIRGYTNKETWALWKNRYVVLKNFIPKDIIEMTLNTWQSVEMHRNSGDILKHETKDITYKNPESSIGRSKGGYCTPWGNALHKYVHDKLDDVIDMELGMTYSYTRRYDRGAYLGSHVDRPSCEISATLCLSYQTDDNTPWPIWVRNDQNYFSATAERIKNESQDLTQRDRLKNGCKKVLLEPGDLLLYQGPNIPHWRDYLLGDYSYHIFLHWYNRLSQLKSLPSWRKTDNHDDLDLVGGNNHSYLELDGREHHLACDNTNSPGFEKLTQEYNENLQACRIGENPAFENTCNYFDDFIRVEK